jgi:hypothetical protein
MKAKHYSTHYLFSVGSMIFFLLCQTISEVNAQNLNGKYGLNNRNLPEASSINSNFIVNNENDMESDNSNHDNDMESNKIKIRANSKVFTATLYDNETANAFKTLLPLTIKMDELNGNEKKYDFSKDFPTDDHNPRQINNGDLMIWSGNTLVLFYKAFSTSYSYTRLGKIDNATGLASALGAGNVTVTFEVGREK